jgi:hypothetical protein
MSELMCLMNIPYSYFEIGLQTCAAPIFATSCFRVAGPACWAAATAVEVSQNPIAAKNAILVFIIEANCLYSFEISIRFRASAPLTANAQAASHFRNRFLVGTHLDTRAKTGWTFRGKKHSTLCETSNEQPQLRWAIWSNLVDIRSPAREDEAEFNDRRQHRMVGIFLASYCLLPDWESWGDCVTRPPSGVGMAAHEVGLGRKIVEK